MTVITMDSLFFFFIRKPVKQKIVREIKIKEPREMGL